MTVAGELELLELAPRERLALLAALAVDDMYEAVHCSEQASGAAARTASAESTAEAGKEAAHSNCVADRALLLRVKIDDRLKVARAVASVDDEIAVKLVRLIIEVRDSAHLAVLEAHRAAAAATSTIARRTREALDAFPPARSAK